jgi:putative phage-type endonuclease
MATLVNAEQRSDEWFKARLGKATASRFNDVMARTRNGYGAQRKNYMAELVTQRLTGNIPETFTSAAMQWGTDNEPLARLAYQLETGNEATETGFWVHEIIPAGASPDGFVNDNGLLEIKCPNSATHLETLQKKELPYQYKAQVQGQLWITEKEWCDFVSFDPRLPENAQMIVIRVERDEDYIKQLEDELVTFLEEVDEQVEFVKNYKGEL